jgi:hypothetical protein
MCTAKGANHVTIFSVPAVIGDRETGNAFALFQSNVSFQSSVMRTYQSVPSTYFTAIERPRCPRCQVPRMFLSRQEAGPPGFEYRTFECQKCGRDHTMIISSDPMKSDVHGWLGGEISPPN